MGCNSGKTFVDFLWYLGIYYVQRSAYCVVLCMVVSVLYGMIICNSLPIVLDNDCHNEYWYKAIKGNWSLLGTHNIRGQISEHISAPN